MILCFCDPCRFCHLINIACNEHHWKFSLSLSRSLFLLNHLLFIEKPHLLCMVSYRNSRKYWKSFFLLLWSLLIILKALHYITCRNISIKTFILWKRFWNGSFSFTLCNSFEIALCLLSPVATWPSIYVADNRTIQMIFPIIAVELHFIGLIGQWSLNKYAHSHHSPTTNHIDPRYYYLWSYKIQSSLRIAGCKCLAFNDNNN